MTKRQFLIALRKTSRTWYVTHTGTLRCGGHCPITRVGFDAGIAQVHDASDYRHAGGHLQLSVRTVTQIVKASDHGWDETVRVTRRALLRACGLAAEAVS